MADLVVIVPSRGRPSAARELAEAFRDTCTGGTELVFSLDPDDPAMADYQRALAPFISWHGGIAWSWEGTEPNSVWVVVSTPGDRPGTMVGALNWAALGSVDQQGDPPFALGFQGDDHRPRTRGWDQAYLDALREMGTGIVYGNDLLQGENLPTQVAMTSDIVRALGYMCPPTLTHLYPDNFWKVLGNGAGCLRYLPDVIVEHMHPVAGKAEWDENYRQVNSSAMYERDSAAFTEWLKRSMVEDVAKVRALRSVHA